MSSSLTTNRNDPDLKVVEPSGMNKKYLVLPEEERAKGFIRPFRNKYQHIGLKPKFPLKDLTKKQKELFGDVGYVKYEKYPKGYHGSALGKYWTQEELDTKGCGVETVMGEALSETYARNPHFYGFTFCVGCRKHLPIKEFIWSADGEEVGS